LNKIRGMKMVDVGRSEFVIGLESGEGNPIPICLNSSPGAGNCDGMVKHGTCPITRVGGKGKFPECVAYIVAQKQKT
jgi:hypothetical protein